MFVPDTYPQNTNNEASDQPIPENPCFNNDRPPPPYGPPRTDDALFLYYDDEFEDQERRWREARPRVLEDEERPQGRWQDVIFDDWGAYAAILLSTMLVVLVLAGAAIVRWISVTQ
jgi:hypothetical protein